MKNLLTLLLLLFTAVAFSQDVIIKTDGSEIKGTVKEITDATIKYTAADNPTGPLYNIATAQVFMVIYANGKRETYTTPRTQQAAPVAAAVTPYDSLMRIGKRQRGWGIALTCFAPVNIGLGVWNLTTAVKETDKGLATLDIVLGGLNIGLGTFELIYGPYLITKGITTIKTAKGYKQQSYLLHYPTPVLLHGIAPGIGFNMQF